MIYPITIKKESKNNWIAAMINNEWAYAYGNTSAEAKSNLEDVVVKSIEAIIEENRELQLKASSFEEALSAIKKYEGIIISDINIDLEVIKKYKKKIRTNVMVRSGYKELAKKRGINISNLLDKALAKELKVEF